MKFIPVMLAALLLFSALPAQNRMEAKKIFGQMVKDSKGDPDGLVEAAEFAKTHFLANESRKALSLALKADAKHYGANVLSGRRLLQDKWIPVLDYEKSLTKVLKQKFKGSDMQEVDGVWVAEAHASDAKKGTFHHNGQLVSRQDKREFLLGKVRHSRTGELIAVEDLEKAEQGQFPIFGKWVDEEEANRRHASVENPWILRTGGWILIGTDPIATLEQESVAQFDELAQRLQPLFGEHKIDPTRPPAIFIVRDTDKYKQIGGEIGGAESAHGAFLSSQPLNLPDSPPRIAVANFGDKTWKDYFLRHAVGLALMHSHTAEEFNKLPSWFRSAPGCYLERFFESSHAKFLGKQHQDKGGVGKIAKWYKQFAIGNSPSNDYMIYQAGLLLSFCMDGEDEEVKAAFQQVSDALSTGKLRLAVKKLEKVLGKHQKQLEDHFTKILQ